MSVRTIVAVLCIVACGNSEPPATTPNATPHDTASSASATPSASASAVASTAPSASAAPSATVAEPAPLKPLKEIVASAKSIQLSWREKLDAKEGLTIAIKTDAAIKGIVNALGADRSPQGGVPGFMTTYAFAFQDASGTTVATVSLCASATMSESNKKFGRIDLPDGTHAGIFVADYAELQKRLKSLGVTLP